MTYFIIAAIVVLLVSFFVKGRLSSRKSDQSMIALVYLLANKRDVTEAAICEAITAEFGVSIEADNPDALRFVTKMPIPPEMEAQANGGKSYMIKMDHGMFLLHNFPIPYVEDPEAFAEQLIDARLQTAVASHTAWLSVDAIGDPTDATERSRLYRAVGRMLAAFGNDDCLAVFCPERQCCNEYDASLRQKLRSQDPLALFNSPTFSPIINIDGDDPRMQSAAQEARDRWSEFCEAFKNRTNAELIFVIKAEFCDGDASEFMWVTVTSIEGDQIRGTLGNAPHQLTNYKEDQDVTVNLADLNDWIFSAGSGSEPVGAFTMKAIEAISSSK